jgi:transposase
VDEARLDRERHGTPIDAIAGQYGVSAKTLQRAFKRMDEKKGVIE